MATDTSYFWSRWHPWFVELGYPMLDIIRYEDGEWAIIQALTKPVIPCLTKWEFVLHGMRNIEISKGFVQKYLRELDMTKRAFWLREERKSRQVEEEWEAKERYAEDIADRATKAVTCNPDLMERIAKQGLQEMRPDNIIKHVPGYRFRKKEKKNAPSGGNVSGGADLSGGTPAKAPGQSG